MLFDVQGTVFKKYSTVKFYENSSGRIKRVPC
jgi:hypothetical protein